MKISIHNGLDDKLEKEVTIDNKSWETTTADAVLLCIDALTAIGFSREGVLLALDEILND